MHIMKTEWKILYDEELLQCQNDSVGIISDGTRVLFFRICGQDDEDRLFLFASLTSLIQFENEETSFPYTMENMNVLLSALNGLDERSIDYCGEGSVCRCLF